MEKKEFGRVLYEKDGAVARVIMNWPEKRNAHDAKMVWSLDSALKEAEKDYDVKVVIIKANGKGFCAGHLIGPGDGGPAYPEFEAAVKATGLNYRGATELFLWPVLYLWEFPKPTIAQVHGFAIGAGSYWALLPDITIAAEDAYFQMPLPQAMGFPTGETMIEPWLFMNWKRTAEYMYTAKTISAQEALQWGAVNKVVPLDKLEQETEAMAARIAEAPLTTVMLTKTLIKRAWELMGMRSHLQMSADLMALGGAATDVRAHMAKMAGRTPRRTLEAREQEKK